ncbi:MerR family transcriptional regulator [Nocardioides marmoribigeumensis]|uniref:DNA-binding transcriptional MerR regulator n=1 Tax=Nocardioides marmoribigeumensis TaxID=433649 RepID=A0ABU2BV58_9ACTN|nr:MerR family transcriptional regulator [Nocardioides marmoribigeumensis]MDR7362141.1 DNA-binding transcriptional MerR regulator [Nocardioides marmoribigeumensis]
MYTVKQAATMSGVAPSTVRAWEQRYDVVTPERSASGYRLYDDGAIQRLRLMSTLIDAGWSAAQAAERVKRSGADGPAPTGAPAGAFPDSDLLVQAAERMDGALLTAAIDEAFSLAGFEHTVTSWLLPSVVAIGQAWEEGRISIAGEHFVTAALQRRISQAYDASGVSSLPPRVLVGLPTRCRHELGALMFATLLRRQHVATRYLGEDLPPEEWMRVVDTLAPTAVVVVCPTVTDVPAAIETVALLREVHPTLLVLTGGQHQDQVTGATPLGHDIVQASAEVARQVQAVATAS